MFTVSLYGFSAAKCFGIFWCLSVCSDGLMVVMRQKAALGKSRLKDPPSEQSLPLMRAAVTFD